MDWSFTAHGVGQSDDRKRVEAIAKAAKILRDADIGLSYAGSVDSQTGSRSLFQASTSLDKLGEEEDDEDPIATDDT